MRTVYMHWCNARSQLRILWIGVGIERDGYDAAHGSTVPSCELSNNNDKERSEQPSFHKSIHYPLRHPCSRRHRIMSTNSAPLNVHVLLWLNRAAEQDPRLSEAPRNVVVSSDIDWHRDSSTIIAEIKTCESQ